MNFNKIYRNEPYQLASLDFSLSPNSFYTNRGMYLKTVRPKNIEFKKVYFFRKTKFDSENTVKNNMVVLTI